VKRAFQILKDLPHEISHKAIDTAIMWHQNFNPNKFEVSERDRVLRDIARRYNRLNVNRETLARQPI
jgi:hypothetical protein